MSLISAYRTNEKELNKYYFMLVVLLASWLPVTMWLYKRRRLCPLCSITRCMWSAERLLMPAYGIQNPNVSQNNQPASKTTLVKVSGMHSTTFGQKNAGYIITHTYTDVRAVL